MPILLAGTIEFVHIEQISALFKFRLIQVSLYLFHQQILPFQRAQKFVSVNIRTAKLVVSKVT
jgi:hypothetical protein